MSKIILRIAAAVAIAAVGFGCTTAYDAYGNPRPVVEPGVAVLGAAAAGLVGYGLAGGFDSYRCGPGFVPPPPGPVFYGGGGYFRPGPCW
jgi:hypothetical protein